MIPAFAAASLIAKSEFQRAPLSMSAEDSHGLNALTTFGNQFRRASATAPLRGPDQLIKMFIAADYGISPTAREDSNRAKKRRRN